MRRALVLATAVAGIAVVGCGGGGPPDGGGTGAPPTTGGSGGASAQQAIQQCEQSIQSAPQLSPDVKSKLERVCAKAARGDEKAVRDATKQVCETIVEESVPSGPARQQALNSCERGP